MEMHFAAGNHLRKSRQIHLARSCTPGVTGTFEKGFGAQALVSDAERFIMIPDHFVYSADRQANQNTRMMRKLSRQQQIAYSYAVGTP
uniref:K01703 3-isopropylmalate/(R)-2-methylmalate dehydratase large subunit n=1 Tax=Erwinia amylovora ATCC BAA-2158 TaxID=889211 RepID=E5B9S6_ERWAM|nr:K01703 3-isopropylmalate/(R)-2-methylmalate dehydratase large subunit [Erwinia amylovora ATCC BAA-2158]